jgi:hypothetical protein
MGLAAAFRREYVYISSILRTLWLLRPVKSHSTRIIADIVAAQAKETPDAPAMPRWMRAPTPMPIGR